MRIVTVSHQSDQTTLRKARYASGFACIRCNTTVYHYCTTEGGPRDGGLFLLCEPCRDALDRTPGAAAVLERLLANPAGRQRDFDRRELPYVPDHGLLDTRIPPQVLMRQTCCPIRFRGSAVVSLYPRETIGGPLQIDVNLGNCEGNPVALVHLNEWVANGEKWGFRHIDDRYVFTSTNRLAELELAFGRDRTVTIRRLRTWNEGHVLEIDADGPRVDGTPVHLPDAELKIVGADL